MLVQNALPATSHQERSKQSLDLYLTHHAGHVGECANSNAIMSPLRSCPAHYPGLVMHLPIFVTPKGCSCQGPFKYFVKLFQSYLHFHKLKVYRQMYFWRIYIASTINTSIAGEGVRTLCEYPKPNCYPALIATKQ